MKEFFKLVGAVVVMVSAASAWLAWLGGGVVVALGAMHYFNGAIGYIAAIAVMILTVSVATAVWLTAMHALVNSAR